MEADGFALLDWMGAALPLGIAIAVALSVVALIWVLLRRLSDHWRRDAGESTAHLNAVLMQSEKRLTALANEASRYSPDLPPPYRDPTRKLYELLEIMRRSLATTQSKLIEIPVPPMTAPVSTSARISYLLWFEPRARHRRRTTLQTTNTDLAKLDESFAAADDLLKMLRRTPLETAQSARDLHAQLDTAFEVLETLQASELHGETLDRVAHSLASHAQSLASLPGYLLDAKESHVLRRARPEDISQVWQVLTRLRPDIQVNLAALEGWQRDLRQLADNLVAMRLAVSNAADRLAEADTQLDVADHHEAWQAAQVLAEEAERRFRRPTPEDLADLAEVAAVTEQANHVVARLVVAEALRLTLNTRFAEATQKLEEAERQLRQLAEAPRYPLDRVPFQTELDRLRLRLARTHDTSSPRSPERFESDLATLQVLDRQIQALVERVTTTREDRRRLVALLDAGSPQMVETDGLDQTNWLTWARDLHAQTSSYASDCWNRAPEIRIDTILTDAEALDARRRRWLPARVDDLLAPETLARQVREVAAIQKEIESVQNRLDQGTRLLQRLRQTEDMARMRLQTVYAALDRLEIVAAALLPAELAEEVNHWARVREHLDTGYGLDLALQNPGTGSLWDKAERVTQWVEACTATLDDWRRTLDAETRTAVDTLDSDLEALRTIARLDHEPPVAQAQDVLKRCDMTPSRNAGRTEPDADPLVDRCVRLAAQAGDQLRTLARLDEVTVALGEKVFQPIGEPVDRWQSAQKEAAAAFGRLQLLEVQSGKIWPPISCDSAVLRPELELAERLQEQMRREDTTVPRLIATAKQLTEIYTRVGALVAERENAYQTLRPKLNELLDRIDDWCGDLVAYGKQHSAEPLVSSAIRARLDDIEAALGQLHVEYDQGAELVPGAEALRVLEALWRQASRDVPVGAGMNVIPVDWIARTH